MDWKFKAAVVLGAFFSWPAYRQWSAGTLSFDAALVRFAIGVAIAYAGVWLVHTVVMGYVPEPAPEPEPEALPDGVEDAVLVEPEVVESPGETADAE